jgi:hypothetical protein
VKEKQETNMSPTPALMVPAKTTCSKSHLTKAINAEMKNSGAGSNKIDIILWHIVL